MEVMTSQESFTPEMESNFEKLNALTPDAIKDYQKKVNLSDKVVNQAIKAFNNSGHSASAFIAKMPSHVQKYLSDNQGVLTLNEEASMDIKTIIFLGIGIYVLAAVLPGALTAFFNASTTGWDTGTVALWGIVPLVVIVAVVLAYIKSAD